MLKTVIIYATIRGAFVLISIAQRKLRKNKKGDTDRNLNPSAHR